VGVGVAHCVPQPPGQVSGQWYTSSALQGGGVHITTGVSVGACGVRVDVDVWGREDVGVRVGVAAGVGDIDVEATVLAVGDAPPACASSEVSCVCVSRLTVIGCDAPSASCVSKALTTMTWVPGRSLCHDCDTM
jgi:hypothetical protein